MFRLPQLRATSSVKRLSCFFSEGPSTSRANEAHAGTEELPPYQSSAKEAQVDSNPIQEASNRMQRWRRKAEGVRVDQTTTQRLLSSNEFQQLVDNEEKYFGEQADDIANILSEMTASLPQEPVLPQPKLSPEEEELRKKTGKMRLRRILYTEGELNNTDLQKPPSRENPHPFNSDSCVPPIYSRTISPYVNKMPSLQTLVDLGVNLFEIDTTTNCGKFFLRLNQEKDIKPKIQWLASIGFEPAEMGDYITRNPFFLLQDLADMQNRVNYLEMMKFKPEQITKIIKEFRYWINTDVKTIDGRLGWIQKQFYLRGNDVRSIVVKEPRIVMFGLGPLKRLFDYFYKECEFTMPEIKRIILKDPRVFMMDHRYVQNNYNFASHVMKLTNAAISESSFILRCSFSNLRNRHEFLRKLGRAHYEGQFHESSTKEDEATLDPITMNDFLHPSDAHFASRAGKSYLAVYNKFLRSR